MMRHAAFIGTFVMRRPLWGIGMIFFVLNCFPTRLANMMYLNIATVHTTFFGFLPWELAASRTFSPTTLVHWMKHVREKLRGS
jgi:hypothetical protein